MIDIYLITGFLGAGKTTLMKNLIKGFQNNKTAIIVNEFGKEGVDGTLLEKEGMVIEEINNGSIFCVCRSDMFIDALIKARELDVEYIIVESSGLADPFGMPKIMNILEKLAPQAFHYSGSICVVDSKNFYKVYETAVAIKNQVQGADLIVINKVDMAKTEEIEEIEKTIKELNHHADIIKTSYSKVDDFDNIYKLQWHKPDMKGILIKKTLEISKYILKFETVDLDELKDWLKEWTKEVYRVKGFCKIKDIWYFIEAVQDQIYIKKIDGERNENFLVVLGPNKDVIKKKIKASWFEKFGIKIEII
ncbi:CobW family GTP-binding protein [Crassaminicella profunda]|uniref:CobW family GTP-binding protein n=1 Tax=Crassaminicella profunda TaxID=1286698 RepID=UPI001CA790FE|nr:CobW family GTP-binding protein [Crassaminicella profunda]QZY54204.1 GTP-binding protein [Crassaminicella profunda]